MGRVQEMGEIERGGERCNRKERKRWEGDRQIRERIRTIN